MKRFILLAMVVALLAAVIWWFQDEPLNDDARAWLADTPAASQAYECLLGMGAAPDQDACEVGERLFRRQQQQADISLPAQVDSPSDNTLLCEYRSADCLLAQQAHVSAANTLLAENTVLRQRYLHLLSVDEFADLTPARLDSEFPRYQLLMAGARLQSLAVAINAQPAQSLVREIQQLRRLLTGQHSLLSKMIVTAMLEEKLRLLALLVQQDRLANPLPAPLSTAEHDMKPALKAEFRLVTTLFLERDYLQHEQSAYERLLFRVGLRPHTTVNRVTGMYRHYMAQADLTPAEREAAPISLPEPDWQSRLRNPVGNLLLEVGTPDMGTYIARLDYLDAQLRLFHWLAGEQDPPGNPWSSHPDTPVQKDQQLCFDTPDYDGRGSPCLPLLTTEPDLDLTP